MANCTVQFFAQGRVSTRSAVRVHRGRTSPMVAKRHTEAIVDHCEGMQTFPHRGTLRDDVRPGLRVTNYKGSAVIAFAVDEAAMAVLIIGLYYGGQDYESVLQLND